MEDGGAQQPSIRIEGHRLGGCSDDDSNEVAQLVGLEGHSSGEYGSAFGHL